MPKVGTVWTFDYTGKEQVFKVSRPGIYKLETWGAQGGGYVAIGGYGGYSIGSVKLKRNVSIYINVGEEGKNSSTDNLTETYNGGGAAYIQDGHANIRYFSNGGGATHIATISGLLSKLETKKENILIVSGAGGGAYYATYVEEIVNGGSAGGYIGSNGSQVTTGWGSFGYGGSSSIDYLPSSGGGSGFYGGGGSGHVQSAGGGSSYIGNTSLYNKAMYCYNCEESNEESTKTISTACTSETPTENCSKQGNGYARITLISY